MDIRLQPIGYVENEVKKRMRHGWAPVQSRLIVDSHLAASLDGLEDFSHIIVLFWMHQVEGDAPAKVHPQGRADMPLVGLFATRAPHRPNSVGMSVVRLLERDGPVLKVVGLDAIDGTPVLDIKPYLPGDNIPDHHFPSWVTRLHSK